MILSMQALKSLIRIVRNQKKERKTVRAEKENLKLQTLITNQVWK